MRNIQIDKLSRSLVASKLRQLYRAAKRSRKNLFRYYSLSIAIRRREREQKRKMVAFRESHDMKTKSV